MITTLVRWTCGAAGAAVLFASGAGELSAQQVQAQPRTISVGIAAGPTFPVGDFADLADMNTGWTVVGHIGWQPPRQAFGLRGEIAYARYGIDALIGDAHLRKWGGAGNVIVTVSNDGNFRPYVIGGIGIYNVREKYEAEVIEFETDNQTRLGLNGGVGARFALGGLTGTLEARYLSVFLEGDSNLNTIPITIGLEF